MKGALSILRRDLGRTRWTVVLFVLLLIGEVAVSCSPLASKAEAESQWFVLVMIAVVATWLVQFLLVTQLIHGDAPSRVGAQWRSRPFRPAHLAMGKIGGILLCVFLPPWLAAQAARLAVGLRPGLGDYEGPLYHLALVSAFVLIAVATTSIARALLTALGLLVGFGFAVALIAPALGTSLATVERPPLPAEVVLSLALIGLATGSLLSGYRKGGLTGSFLGIAWICCLWFVLNGGPTPRQQPLLADATENFRLVVTWGKDNWDDGKQGWYGALRHMRTKPRRVVADASPYVDFGSSYSQWWPAIVPADAPARVDGLGGVEFVPVAERFIRTRQIGPLDPARLGSEHVGPGFGDADYTIRTYDLLGRLRFDETPGRSGPTWSMRSLENPRRVEIRTLEPNAKAATFDPATNRLKPINAMPVFPSAFWPIGAGVRVVAIANEPKSECVLLSETIVGKGLVSYEYLPMDVPADWRSRPDAK